MSESFEFELKLIDSVSRAAARAAGAVKMVDDQAKKAQKTLDFSKELQRTEDALKKIQFDPKGYRELLKAQKELSEQRNKIKKSLGGESMMSSFTNKLGFGRMVTASFVGDLLAEGLIEAIKKPIEMFVEGIKKAFEAGGKQEKLRLSYELMFGKEGGKAKMEDQERFSKNTRFTGSEIGRLMIPLFNSGMNDKAARQAFSTASDLEARTGKPIEEFVEMLAKINTKGGITEKMLLGIGINAKAFYAELGKSQHMTADQAKKRASEGKFDPQLLINQLTGTVNKAQGGEAGTGGKKLSETMAERFEKLSKLPELYFERMSDSPAWQKLSDKVGEVFERLSPDSDQGKKIMASLFSIFDKLADTISSALTPENLEAFAAGVQGALQGVSGIITGLKEAIDLITGETLSKALFSGDESNKKLASIKFKQKELAMGSFQGPERAEREKEIGQLIKGLSPSEREDFNRSSGGAPMPKASPAVAGGKVINMTNYINTTATVHPPKDDTNHTGQKVSEQSATQLVNHLERAVNGG